MHDSCDCDMCVDEKHVVKMMKHLLMIQKLMLIKLMFMKLMLTKHKLIKSMCITAMFKYVDENHVDRNHVDQNHVDRNHVDRDHVDRNHFRSHGCTEHAQYTPGDRSRDLILSTMSQRILRGRDLILICGQGRRTVVEKVVH